MSLESGEVSSEVCELVEYVWQAAVGELTDILAVPIENVKMEQVWILAVSLLKPPKDFCHNKRETQGGH